MESKKHGTDEPICRTGIEMQTEYRLVDTAGEGGGGHTERVALRYIHYHV